MLVSVVMSVYNSDKYLDDAINSILNQSYKEFEFLIIDDGSSDNSEAIIKKYAANDRRIVLIKNEKNLGLASSLNKGIHLAKGKYIARQDADDLSAPDRLEKQVEFALRNSDIDVIGSNCFIIDISGSVVYQNKTYSKRRDFNSNLLNCKAIFPHGSVLLKKNKVLEVGLYDPRFYYSQDGELWLRMISNKARIHIMEQPLYYYRSAPRAFNKKYLAQCMYNNVKQMIYADGEKPEVVKAELEKVKIHIANSEPILRPFYMADYWKSLANGAYLNGGKLSVSYKYIIKAVQERNSPKNYIHYLAMCCMYLFPSKMVKSIFRIDQGTI